MGTTSLLDRKIQLGVLEVLAHVRDLTAFRFSMSTSRSPERGARWKQFPAPPLRRLLGWGGALPEGPLSSPCPCTAIQLPGLLAVSASSGEDYR